MLPERTLLRLVAVLGEDVRAEVQIQHIARATDGEVPSEFPVLVVVRQHLEQRLQRRLELTVGVEVPLPQPLDGLGFAALVVDVHRGVDGVQRAWEREVVCVDGQATRPVFGLLVDVLHAAVVPAEADVAAALPPGLRRALDLVDVDADTQPELTAVVVGERLGLVNEPAEDVPLGDVVEVVDVHPLQVLVDENLRHGLPRCFEGLPRGNLIVFVVDDGVGVGEDPERRAER